MPRRYFGERAVITHRFTVPWRSPSGRAVKLENGALNLLYEEGTQGC